MERPPPRAILDDLTLALDTSVSDIGSPVLEEQPKPMPPAPYIARRSSPSSLSPPTQLPPSGDSATTESPNSLSPLSPHVSRKKESGSSFESR